MSFEESKLGVGLRLWAVFFSTLHYSFQPGWWLFETSLLSPAVTMATTSLFRKVK